MKKALLMLIAALLVMGTALAQDYDDQIKVGKESVTVTEKIRVKIPKRVALHIQEKKWDLDLSADVLPGFKDHEGCLLVPKQNQYNIHSVWDLHQAAYYGEGSFSYPAYISDGDNGVAYSEKYGWLKGGLVCHNSKVIQKFSNAGDGWEFTVDVKLPEQGSVGQFFIGEYPETQEGQMPDITAVNGGAITSTGFDSLVLAAGNGTTHGFLDDIIYEGFYFDGTEVAGNYNVDVMFTLTGKF